MTARSDVELIETSTSEKIIPPFQAEADPTDETQIQIVKPNVVDDEPSINPEVADFEDIIDELADDDEDIEYETSTDETNDAFGSDDDFSDDSD